MRWGTRRGLGRRGGGRRFLLVVVLGRVRRDGALAMVLTAVVVANSLIKILFLFFSRRKASKGPPTLCGRCSRCRLICLSFFFGPFPA